MSNLPIISLVICTRNRAAALETALRSYEAINASVSHEFVMVNNGSTDDTQSVLEAFRVRNLSRVRLVLEAQPGIARARNAGIRACSGSIIAFTDDDCYPATDFLDRIADCFHAADIDFLAGQVLLYDSADLRITIQEHDQPITFPPGTYINPGVIHGANFSFRREALERIGNFDTQLGAGTLCNGGEDTDIVTRLSLAGFSGAYDPGPLVYHHHRRRTRDDERAILRIYGNGRGAFFMKGLLNSQTRRAFILPIGRRIAGHIIGLRREEFLDELAGARAYLRLFLHQKSNPLSGLSRP